MGALLDHDGLRRLLCDSCGAGDSCRMEQLPEYGERPGNQEGGRRVSRGREEVVVTLDPNQKQSTDPDETPEPEPAESEPHHQSREEAADVDAAGRL